MKNFTENLHGLWLPVAFLENGLTNLENELDKGNKVLAHTWDFFKKRSILLNDCSGKKLLKVQANTFENGLLDLMNDMKPHHDYANRNEHSYKQSELDPKKSVTAIDKFLCSGNTATIAQSGGRFVMSGGNNFANKPYVKVESNDLSSAFNEFERAIESWNVKKDSSIYMHNER